MTYLNLLLHSAATGFYILATNLLPRIIKYCFLLEGMSVYKTRRFFYTLNDLNKKLFNNLRFSKNLCQSQFIMEEDIPVEKSIEEKLKSAFKPLYIKIINESYMHNVPKGSKTHFKIFVVSQEFENMALLKRHRLVNSLLEEELKNGIHALSIVVSIPLVVLVSGFIFQTIKASASSDATDVENHVLSCNENHAAKAPSQWDPNEEITPSPKCLGGFGK